MRTPRVVIIVFFIVACLFISFRALSAAFRPSSRIYRTAEIPDRKHKDTLWGLMYYNTPFTLFPPNAAISLTDDNSTSFAARPAAFGPRLEAGGLSGQLWVGSGFPEDGRDEDGEMGCSDLPGWDGGTPNAQLKNSLKTINAQSAANDDPGKIPRAKRAVKTAKNLDLDLVTKSRQQPKHTVNDGTDDYLHAGLGSPVNAHDTTASSHHADIQSMQEAAEIQGKVVLLMRGGCGFLEKVMWAQRRGAVAVIVGDNEKGGPLIQMFAHGEEVENVTIPSVFTARTTAHLLSSLTQPGSFIEDILEDGGNAVLKVQPGLKPKGIRKKPLATLAKQENQQVSSSSNKDKRSSQSTVITSTGADRSEEQSRRQGWLSKVFAWVRSSRTVDEDSRPPRSGRLGWKNAKAHPNKDNTPLDKSPVKTDSDFVIGVHDWRDPDLVDKSGARPPKGQALSPKGGLSKVGITKPDSLNVDKKPHDVSGSSVGSITPGSGEYKAHSASKDGKAAPLAADSDTQDALAGHGLISKLFGEASLEESQSKVTATEDAEPPEPPTIPKGPPNDTHEGLWVTITPTSSASPFFDTLLVLVISPLVTLSVVYALLILRAKIRRRRWRAPKSVVERLPVRTFHAVAASPAVTPRIPSPSSATQTTPLLQQIPPRRPRSRTTTGVFATEDFLNPGPALPTPHSMPRNKAAKREKGPGGVSAEWKKYMARQIECVVCLEEYVDGVSKVMSLPCGHEFHVECITPWLTTRRRTCPICKGDVVRSLDRGESSSEPRYEPYQDDSDYEPVAESSDARGQRALSENDVESQSSPRRVDRSWLDYFTLASSSPNPRQHRSRAPSPEDRDR